LKFLYAFIIVIFLMVKAQAGHQEFNTLSSWYGSESGKFTANGAHWNPNGLTVAHRSLKLGTRVRLTNLRNGKTVVATVTDRGPFVRGRDLDCSKGVANVLGFLEAGTAVLHVEVL
jgi:rare lipoprotein A